MGLIPDKTLTRMWRALPAQFSSVVGEQAELGALECAREWDGEGRQYYFAHLELVEPRTCSLYMVFELGLAIACAGRLMVKPDRAIRENIDAKTFDGDDIDAMGECVNTFCAALNEALRAGFGDGYRVVFREGSREGQGIAALGALGVGRGELSLGGLARGSFALVIPDELFVSARDAGADDEKEEDEDADEDDDAEDEDDEAAPAADDAAPAKRAKKKKRKAVGRDKGSAREGREDPPSTTSDAGDSPGPLLTSEELDAIREATRAAVRGTTMVVAPGAGAQAQWRQSLAELGVEFDIVDNHHQLLAACRARAVDAVIVDADVCAAGGLSLLAAIRGCVGVPTRRVVVASQPTHTHLVACIGGGASEYVCRPLDDDAIARLFGAGA